VTVVKFAQSRDETTGNTIASLTGKFR